MVLAASNCQSSAGGMVNHVLNRRWGRDRASHAVEPTPRRVIPPNRAGRCTSTRNVAWMGRPGSVFHERAGPILTKVARLAGAAMFG